MSGEVGDTRGRYLWPEERSRLGAELQRAAEALEQIGVGEPVGVEVLTRRRDALQAVRRSLELLRGPTPAERPPGSARPG